MWSGPGPTFCTAASCRFFVISSTRKTTNSPFVGGSLRRTDELFASLEQGAVAARRGEQGEEAHGGQRKQHRIERKCLNHQVRPERMVNHKRAHTLEYVGGR